MLCLTSQAAPRTTRGRCDSSTLNAGKVKDPPTLTPKVKSPARSSTMTHQFANSFFCKFWQLILVQLCINVQVASDRLKTKDGSAGRVHCVVSQLFLHCSLLRAGTGERLLFQPQQRPVCPPLIWNSKAANQTVPPLCLQRFN